MSNKLDRYIRELFEELDGATPVPPLLPKRPERSRNWGRMLVPAGASAAVLLFIAVAGQMFLGQADSGADTTAAAADTTVPVDQPPDTRPPDLALVLADLNQACGTFIDESFLAVPSTPASHQDHLDALTALAPTYRRLDQKVGEARSALGDPAFDSIAADTSDLHDLVEEGSLGAVAQARSVYEAARADTIALGDDLDGYGALDCAGLALNLP